MWSTFGSVISFLLEENIPLTIELKKQKGHWISRPTLKLVKQRSQAWKIYCQLLSTSNYEEYCKIRNKVNTAVRQDDGKYKENMLKGYKGNPETFYGYMKGLQKVKDHFTLSEES